MPFPQSDLEIQRDIAHFEAQLAKLPLDSDDPDDHFAREIFERLLHNCRCALNGTAPVKTSR